MRDRQTNRGRGFGFVKMQFENRDKAQEHKHKLLRFNVEGRGHCINEKRVDVKSADDYVKPQLGQQPNMQNLNPKNPAAHPGQSMDDTLKTMMSMNNPVARMPVP